MISIHLDWLKENQMAEKFKELPVEDITEILHQFYGTVLMKRVQLIWNDKHQQWH